MNGAQIALLSRVIRPMVSNSHKPAKPVLPEPKKEERTANTMPRKTVEEMLRERAELDRAIEAERARTSTYTPAMHLAERLHERKCPHNHTYGCSSGNHPEDHSLSHSYLSGLIFHP
jgi:hypothetical protein